MKKIIVAEDEIVTRRLLCSIVTKLNYVPVACSRGDTALEILMDNPDVSLVMTDVEMPGLGGRELIRKKMEMEALKSIPFIIISGVVKLSEISDLLQSGASYFMPKPINTEDLAGYIRRLVDSRKFHETSEKDLHSKLSA